MDNVQMARVWALVFMMFLFKGVLNQDVPINHARSVTAWTGSCAILPCAIYDLKVIDHYWWIYNPEYVNEKKTESGEFKGPIVYSNTRTVEVTDSYKDRVEYNGKTIQDCTILIKDLQSEHSGKYKLRLFGKRNKDKLDKWISVYDLTLNVSDTGPGLKLHSNSKMEENTPVTLTCSIDYYCPLYNISLTWDPDVNGTVKIDIKNDTREIRTTTTLTFVPSWEDNNKNISCVLQRSNETNESQTIQLDVQYAPKNVKIMPDSPIIRFREGGDVTLECSVESSNPPEFRITWYKNKQKLQEMEESKKLFYESGRYHCEAENRMGRSTSNTVEISVLHRPKSVSIQIPKGTIKEGSPVTLNCSTLANPPVSLYTWYKNGQECFNGTDSRYNFSSITENDSGSYECEASNDQGSGTSPPVQIDVKYAPKNVKVVIKPDNKQFLEGTEVTFQCVVNSSNPNVKTITWHKNDRRVASFSKTKTLQAEDAGTYSCTATNDIGTSSSDAVYVEVLYSPKRSSCEIDGNNKEEKDEVTLKCPSQESHPKISSYEWFKGGKLYKETASDSLNFPNVQWTDAGDYSCRAVNTIGRSSEGKCDLQVRYAPKDVTVSVSPGNIVSENTDVKLTCSAKAHPPELWYTWYHKDEAIKNHYRIRIYNDHTNYALDNIQRSHAGEYYCTVENSMGSNRSQALYLHVSYSSYTIGVFSAAVIGSSIIILIMAAALIIRFRICFRLKNCMKTDNDRSDASFFVLKKAHNELLDHLGQNTPSEDSLTEQINYASLRFPAATDGGQSQSSPPDPDAIYSVVKKPVSAAEYENVESSKITQDDSQDEIHYSIITNLTKGPARERPPEVEYAMLRN